MLSEIAKQIEGIKTGQVHSAEFEMKKPIFEHLNNFEKSQKPRNNSSRHIHDTISKIKRCIDQSGQRKDARKAKYLWRMRQRESCVTQCRHGCCLLGSCLQTGVSKNDD